MQDPIPAAEAPAAVKPYPISTVFKNHAHEQGLKVVKAYAHYMHLAENLGGLSVDQPMPEATSIEMRMHVCRADAARENFLSELERLQPAFRKECAPIFIAPPHDQPFAREKARTAAAAVFKQTINDYLGEVAKEAGTQLPPEGNYFHMGQKQRGFA